MDINCPRQLVVTVSIGLAALLLGSWSAATAQINRAVHTATVTVEEIAFVKVVPSVLSFGDTSFYLTSNPKVVQVTSPPSTLIWRTNGERKKITVHLDQRPSRYSLRVKTGCEGSSSQPVTIEQTPTDLLFGAGQREGTCKLTYIGEAALTEGAGKEQFPVVFTLTDR